MAPTIGACRRRFVAAHAVFADAVCLCVVGKVPQKGAEKLKGPIAPSAIASRGTVPKASPASASKGAPPTAPPSKPKAKDQKAATETKKPAKETKKASEIDDIFASKRKAASDDAGSSAGGDPAPSAPVVKVKRAVDAAAEDDDGFADSRGLKKSSAASHPFWPLR